MSHATDLTARIQEFELGRLDLEETKELFQDLIDTGVVWQLQGAYGRMAERMVKAGWCTMPTPFHVVAEGSVEA